MKKYVRFFVSLFIAVLFLWLALKNISFTDLRLTINTLTYYWLFPYVFVTLLSHYLRAERWKQLIDQEGIKTNRLTLFSGVMLGYLINYAVPRLGEVSRSVFVGKKEQISRTKLVGTVVLERAIDLLVMLILILIVIFYLFSDYSIIIPIIGTDTVKLLQAAWSVDGIIFFGLMLILVIFAIVLGYMLFRFISWLFPSASAFFEVIADSSRNFGRGFISIKEVKNWPLFTILTVGIWFCYVLMTYIPFTAFDMHNEYGLGLQSALVITVVSALGVSLPSPGGIGTYHWFVSSSLLFIFSVPETIGVAYAIVTHLVMMIIILVTTPLLLAMGKAEFLKYGT